jgi:hypothetical protein
MHILKNGILLGSLLVSLNMLGGVKMDEPLVILNWQALESFFHSFDSIKLIQTLFDHLIDLI